ncbi:MAG: hypothetical protein HGA19_05035 [Oscillochloris sp.]|nr:hypothetical protein [Oscillochloris sp.]
MHLALAPRRRLQHYLGPAYPQTSVALDAALAARAATGISQLTYDPEEGLPQLGVGPAELNPADLIAQLAAIDRALAERNGIMVESLWVIGGPAVVPFGVLPNPMRDHDGPILSDWVYGMVNAQDMLARWPVGHTPDAGTADPHTLAKLLWYVAEAYKAGPPSPGPALGISSARWAAVSADVLATAGESAENLLLVPPLQSGAINRECLAQARRIYCNLHGVIDRATWYGQSAGDSELVPALSPADVAGLRMTGAVVITQACFGARLRSVRGEHSLALALLHAGASIIGAIGISYGSPDPPMSESDLLAQQLLFALRQPHQRLGTAFQAAHMAMLRDVLRLQGGLDPDDMKTLLQFMLYGDPAMPV